MSADILTLYIQYLLDMRDNMELFRHTLTDLFLVASLSKSNTAKHLNHCSCFCISNGTCYRSLILLKKASQVLKIFQFLLLLHATNTREIRAEPNYRITDIVHYTRSNFEFSLGNCFIQVSSMLLFLEFLKMSNISRHTERSHYLTLCIHQW